jgi:hypothetical protein
MFQSRKAKIFCSMKCYTTSDKFREMIREVHERLKAKPRKPPTMVEKTCMECGTGFSVLQRSKAKRFCTRLCYRRYMEKRFDRFIANPEEIALPQCYDEFLSQPVLHCLVKDCGWMGHALSNHMNYTHGIRARDFKKAAGFNLNSGIVSATMQEHLSGREYLGGVAVYTYPQCAGVRTSYKSLEGREHAQKAQALARYTYEKERTCAWCKTNFMQSSSMGRALFCSRACRNERDKSKLREKIAPLTCVKCGASFIGTKAQSRRGKPTCSFVCRGRLNSEKLRKGN